MEGEVAPGVWQGSHHTAHRIVSNRMKDFRIAFYRHCAGN
jgi:hypothetical protein